ncbi:MAG TPA: hypothetical protein VEB64_05625 [Azospirillaceae bacterium]|nr:hypothetical protein [Azospirillaceae bacterium]
MKYDERFYRSPQGKPSLQMLRAQLERVRLDYERFSGKDTTSSLRLALKQKIAELEAEIHGIEKARAAAAHPPAEPEPEPSEGDLPVSPRRAQPSATAASRRFPPRFRATTAGS